MRIFIITYKGKAVTRGEVHDREGKSYSLTTEDRDQILAARHKNALLARFIYLFGYKWQEWVKAGYAVKAVEV